ncbi:MAG: c-type cytochrome [Gammaproteobacteria bacterium]
MTRLLAAMATVFFAASVSAAPGLLGAENSMHPDSIKARIAPVGGVCVQGEECKPAGLAAAPVAAAAGGAAASRSGDAVYNAACGACHAAGIAGAPKTGNKADWGPRIAQGESVLIDHALNGIRGMPARGACGSCTDDEIGAAVKYMVSQSK